MTMKVEAVLVVILGLLWCSYCLIPDKPQNICQGKCNSTASCDLLLPHCACPTNNLECNKSSLVGVNNTDVTEKDQCCYCDNHGTHCMLDQGDVNHAERGLNDTGKLILVFFENCEELEVNKSTQGNFIALFSEAFHNWTNINTTSRLVIKENITCTFGDVPTCGVDTDAWTAPPAIARRRRSVQDNEMDEKNVAEVKHDSEKKTEETEEEQKEEYNDPEAYLVKSRVRRKLGGGRMRSSTKSNKGGGLDLDLDYTTGYGYVEEITSCNGLAVHMELLPGNDTMLTAKETISLLIGLMLNESLVLKYSSDMELVVEMMFSGVNNETLVMSRIPYPEKYDGPRFIPPMEMDFRPFIYSVCSLLGMFFIIITYKMIKHTFLLRKNVFTKINSDAIKIKKVRLPAIGKKRRKKENAENDKQGPNFNMSFRKVPTVDNDRLAREYDWTTPIYLPGMLDPVVNVGSQSCIHQHLDVVNEGDKGFDANSKEVDSYNTKF